MIVQKFGGTSVGSLERIQNVAKIVSRASKKNKICVVCSAMSGETDRLLGLYKQIRSNIFTPEYDLLLASGEQAAIALVSACLNESGLKSVPLLGFQAGFITDQQRSKARIESMQIEKIQNLINEGIIPVVAGFQGVDQDGFITTLGRGGSDTSAVALAAALKAKTCEIYTDVQGVYSTDPRICSDAKRITRLSFDEMLELASLGAKVLHPRCVELASKYNVPIKVLSSFELGEGTMIDSNDTKFESPVVTAITYDHNSAFVKLKSLRGELNIFATIFGLLSEKEINVDIIVHTTPRDDGSLSIGFTIPKEDVSEVTKIFEEKNYKFEIIGNLSKVSIVGSGMRSHVGVAARMFKTLAKCKAPVSCTSTSEIKVSCMIPTAHVPEVVRALHEEYKLGEN